jgi:SnoaL-like protein
MASTEREVRTDIRAVIDEYFRCVDAHDFAGAGRCFTTDVESEFAGIVLAGGPQAIVDFLDNAMRTSANSHHFATNVSIRRDSEATAHAETAALVFAVRPDSQGGTELLTRGVRYADDLRLVDGSWLIGKRVHRGEWVASAPVTMLSPPDPAP